MGKVLTTSHVRGVQGVEGGELRVMSCHGVVWCSVQEPIVVCGFMLLRCAGNWAA